MKLHLLIVALMVVSALPVVAEVALPLPADMQSDVPGIARDPAANLVTDPAHTARLAALSDTLLIGRVMDVMRDEGLEYGTSLQKEMFPDADETRWQAIVGRIYDPLAMRAAFDAVMAVELTGDPAALAEMEAFFGSEIGQRILTLEIDARAAMLDTAVEEAAKVAAKQLAEDRDPLIAQIERFASAGDLIEMNVAGALTSNLAFYKGMAAEGAFAQVMTEEEMLTEVWQQEADIRAETESWLMPYLALAYKPLASGDLEAYIAFSESQAGHRMNAAMFAAFDAVFTAISHDLGRAAARQMQGDDI